MASKAFGKTRIMQEVSETPTPRPKLAALSTLIGGGNALITDQRKRSSRRTYNFETLNVNIRFTRSNHSCSGH